MPGLDELQIRLGYRFQNEALLTLALTHPSVAQETGNSQHNQRLEFLGDSVLGLIVARELYHRFPGFGEGPLTKARAQLVNGSRLAEHGRRVDLGSHLILSRGEESSGGRQRATALADAFEALLGAMFLDGGMETVREFILREFAEDLAGLNLTPGIENPKGELQELLQEQSIESPQYDLLSATGPDHDRIFECVVTHGGQELGRGKGKSKKAAESEAALAALEKLRSQEQPKITA